MALSNRFIFQFISHPYGERFTVTILKEGYVGSADVLTYAPGRDFCVLSYDKNETNILHPIRGANLSLRLSLTPPQIEEFLTAEATDFQVVVEGDTFEWRGWYQPQNELNFNPYKISTIDLQFSDVAILKNKKDNVLETAFIEKQTIADMVERQLAKSDFNYSITYGTNSIEHDDHPGEHIKDVIYLEQAVTLEYDGKLPQDCHNLLSKEMRLMQSCLYQKNGGWSIDNIIDKRGTATQNFFELYKPLDRDINVRYMAAANKVIVKSYHYDLRHTQPNRDFDLWALGLPIDWEESLGIYDFVDQQTVDGKNYAKIWGNYSLSDSNSRDYFFPGDVGTVGEGDILVIVCQYEITRPEDNPEPQIAINLSGTPDWWLKEDGTWVQQAGEYIIRGEADIAGILNVAIAAPATGSITFRIYRPYIDGASFDGTKSYIRFGYLDIFSNNNLNVNENFDYKLYKSIATVDSKSFTENVEFETIGLHTDTEFQPNGAAGQMVYGAYVTPFYVDATSSAAVLPSKWRADYMNLETYSISEMHARAYARLYDKPFLLIEATVIGQNLSIGDVFTVSLPGLPSGETFVVLAYEYDLKQCTYSVLLSQIPSLANPSETHIRNFVTRNGESLDT